jgi:hypothetical protein
MNTIRHHHRLCCWRYSICQCRPDVQRRHRRCRSQRGSSGTRCMPSTVGDHARAVNLRALVAMLMILLQSPRYWKSRKLLATTRVSWLPVGSHTRHRHVSQRTPATGDDVMLMMVVAMLPMTLMRLDEITVVQITSTLTRFVGATSTSSRGSRSRR